jgi:hypothetical protein
MSETTIKPKRPEYKEPEPTNRRVYFAAVDSVKALAGGVTAIPRLGGNVLLGLFEFSTRWFGFIIWAVILVGLYEAGHTVKTSTPTPASQTASGVTHLTHQAHHTQQN